MKGSIETRVKAVIARYFNLPPSKVREESAGTDPSGGVVVVGFGAAVSMALGNREELNLIRNYAFIFLKEKGAVCVPLTTGSKRENDDQGIQDAA